MTNLGLAGSFATKFCGAAVLFEFPPVTHGVASEHTVAIALGFISFAKTLHTVIVFAILVGWTSHRRTPSAASGVARFEAHTFAVAALRSLGTDIFFT